jgi:hypothetical protein
VKRRCDLVVMENSGDQLERSSLEVGARIFHICMYSIKVSSHACSTLSLKAATSNFNFIFEVSLFICKLQKVLEVTSKLFEKCMC